MENFDKYLFTIDSVDELLEPPFLFNEYFKFTPIPPKTPGTAYGSLIVEPSAFIIKSLCDPFLFPKKIEWNILCEGWDGSGWLEANMILDVVMYWQNSKKDFFIQCDASARYIEG
jgi:hypothetical protein